MARQIHIAVLECDTPVGPVVASRGTYGDIFQQLLSRALPRLTTNESEVQYRITKWDVVAAQSYPQVDEIDALLISGSTYSDEPWIIKLVEYVSGPLKTASKPVVGICFGHQIIGRALGAELGPSPAGWEISVGDIQLSEDGQQLFGVPSLRIHQMHRDAVLRLPDGLTNLGSSPKCEIQGLYKPGCVFSVQGHPEFDEQIMSAILEMRHEQGIFDDAMFKDAMSRADKQHDGILISSAIWRFILEV